MRRHHMKTKNNTKHRTLLTSLVKAHRVTGYIVATLALTVPCKQALSEFSFEEFNSKIVQNICGGNTNWLRCYGQDPFRCEKIADPIVEKCVTKEITLQLVKGRSKKDVPQLSKNLEECIRETVASTLGPTKDDSKECKGPHF